MPSPNTVTRGRSRKDPKPQLASNFVDIVARGGSLKDASEATGLPATDALVKQRLTTLGIFAPLVKNEETRDLIANAVLMEKALDDTLDPTVQINAAKALQRKSDGALIEINLSEEIMKLKPGKLYDDDNEEETK